jgi:hypothetical protein
MADDGSPPLFLPEWTRLYTSSGTTGCVESKRSHKSAATT